MNKFVLSALALTTTGGLAAAGGGSEEWLTLDREIESLASTLAPQGSGLTVNGFVRSSYVNSGDPLVAVLPSGNDLGGFNLDNARLSVTGAVGDFSVHVSAEGSNSVLPGTGTTFLPFVTAPFVTGSGGALAVLDAHAAWNINEMLRLTMGRFLPPFLANSLINENHMLFLNHTVNGAIWSGRDTGVMLSGQYDMFGFWVSLINGLDGVGDELAFAVRAEFNAMGGGVGSTVEGAYRAEQGNQLTIGAGYFSDDGNSPDDIAFAVDAVFSSGPISAAAEIVDYDAGSTRSVAGLIGLADSTTWAVQAGFMLVPDRWEAAVRYEDLDTGTETTIITAGINYYMAGHDAKFQLNYSTVDDDVIELDFLALGMTASV